MKELGREKWFYYEYSKVYETTYLDWLQEGMMSAITGKISSLIQYQKN